jgi:hypothetical protein
VTTYTLFGQASPGTTTAGTGNNGTNGLHFTVSAASALAGIWHYSPSGATQLPTSIGLYTITTLGTSGTLVHSETVSSWSGAAGSGWVLALFASPPSLSPGTDYMATQFRNDAVNRWFDFYAVTWPVSSGILTAPKDESTSALSQGWYNTGTAMAFPTTQTSTAGDNFGMDVSVATSGASASPQPPKPVRGKRAARKSRLRSSAGSPYAAAPPPAGGYLLTEAGGRLLTEAGSFFLTEAGAPAAAPPFTVPGAVTRGKAVLRKARLRSSPGSPVVLPAPATPSPFAVPPKAVRGKAAARKSRLGWSPGSPVVLPVPPSPSPFRLPAVILRAHAAARKARLAGSPGSPVVPPAVSPFPVPPSARRGKPAARKSRLAGSAGSPVVLPVSSPAPFSLPGSAKRGRPAARKARLAGSAGSPYAAPPPVAPAGTWAGAYAVPGGYFFPSPAARPLQVPVTNTAGDWLFAVIAWRPSVTGSGVSAVVADDAHNWWEPVGAPAADSGAPGAVRTAVWAAPAARVANSVTGVTNVQVAATGPVLSLACTIVDMSGLLPWYQAAVITGNYGNAVSSLALSAGAPPASALLFAAFGSDNNSDTVTGPSGWSGLTGASASNGTDHTADIRLTPAWQVTGASSSASVSSSGSLDLAGVIAGVLVSAPQPAQPNPDWPVMITEAAIGSGVMTPPSQMTWTTLAGRSLALSIQQGRQYSLGQLQAGQGTITLDDPDGSLIPPGTGAYAGIDSGTPLRRRVIWPGLPGGAASPTPNYVAFSGYFRRWPWNMDASMLRGQVQAEIADAWAYGNGQLNAMAVEECLLDNPHSLWPLTDPPGSTGAGNLVPNGAPLPLLTSKFGDGGATVTWGANSGALTGMSSAKVTASGTSGGAAGMYSQDLGTGTALSTPGYGYALAASDSSYPPVSGGVTLECWAQLQLGATQRGGSSTTSPRFGGTSSLNAGQAVVLEPVPGFTFPTGPSAGVGYFVLSTGTQYDLSVTPGGGAVNVTANGSFYITPTTAWNPVILAARGVHGTVAQLEVDKIAGALILRYRPAAAVSDTLVTVDSAIDYRNGALAHFSLSFTQSAWRVMVNAGSQVNASGTFSGALPATFPTACFGGVMDRVNQGSGFTGNVALCGVFPGVSQQDRVVSRYWGTGFGMSGEGADDRAERLLEYAGLAGRRWIGPQASAGAGEGDLVVSGQDIGGQAAVSSISNVVQSTLPAYAAVAPTGDVVYRSKLYTWNEPARWTLGDDTAAGEIPFAPGSMATDYDPSRVTADVQLTQLDTQAVTVPSGVMSATTMAAVAATAEGQYGGTPYQNTGYLDFDWSSAYNAGGSLTDLANWVQAVYAKPANRIQAVTVDAARHPAAWPFWAAAAVGDMVTVNVRLPTAATSPLISLVARITQTARSSQFSQETAAATITATLDFAPEYNALTCDDPVRGKLDGSNVMPW